MTKNEDVLRGPLCLDDIKVEVVPKFIDNSLIISAPHISNKKKRKTKVRTVRAKVIDKKSRLEKATSQLYDLEDRSGPEKMLDIDFGLYQMESF